MQKPSATARPTVSIVLGAYNKQDYISESIQSVIDQTYPDFEFIIVDDASTDKTKAQIDKFGDHRIRRVNRDVNSGCPGVPRNQGAALAKGEFIALLDADDLWHPNKLEQQVAFMRQHPDLVISHTACRVISGDGSFIKLRHGETIPATGNIFLPLLHHCFITTSSVMFKPTILNEIGFMQEGPQWRTGEDYEFFLRVAARFRVGFLPELLTSYRSHQKNQSISQESRNWRGIPEHVPTLLYLADHPEIWSHGCSKKEVLGALSDSCLANAWYWHLLQDKRKKLWFIYQAIKHTPFNMKIWKFFICRGFL